MIFWLQYIITAFVMNTFFFKKFSLTFWTLFSDEIYKTATTSIISPALHEELLRNHLSSADIAEIGPVYAKTLPARHQRSSSHTDRKRRYSATSRVDRIILKSLLESKHEIDTKTLPRKNIRHLPGKMSFKKQLWWAFYFYFLLNKIISIALQTIAIGSHTFLMCYTAQEISIHVQQAVFIPINCLFIFF